MCGQEPLVRKAEVPTEAYIGRHFDLVQAKDKHPFELVSCCYNTQLKHSTVCLSIHTFMYFNMTEREREREREREKEVNSKSINFPAHPWCCSISNIQCTW